MHKKRKLRLVEPRANRLFQSAVDKFKPLMVAASIDTVELFFVRPPNGLRTSIETKLGRRVIIKPCLDKTGYSRGVRVAINWPTRALLPILTSLAQAHHGARIHRVDIALDLTMATQALADEFVSLIDRHLVLKWRPAGTSKNAVETTKYWATGCRTRNLVCYKKGPRKIRIELRFLNAGSVRRAHLHIPGDWHSLNPSKYFERHLSLAVFNNRRVLQTVRRSVAKERRGHIEKRRSYTNAHPFLDVYRAKLAQRSRYILDRVDMQSFLARNGSLSWVERLPLSELFNVPTSLTWPDQAPQTSTCS